LNNKLSKWIKDHISNIKKKKEKKMRPKRERKKKKKKKKKKSINKWPVFIYVFVWFSTTKKKVLFHRTSKHIEYNFSEIIKTYFKIIYS
jgi:ABC-type phosphate/phosphonate transport system permease subunit